MVLVASEASEAYPEAYPEASEEEAEGLDPSPAETSVDTDLS